MSGRSVLRRILTPLPGGKWLMDLWRHVIKGYIVRSRRYRLQKHGAEIFRKVQDILSPMKVPYFAAYGTLLGLVRENGFISHDDDVDFGILPGFNRRVAMLQALLKGGFEFRRAFVRDGQIVELSFRYKKVPVDFFFWGTDGNKTWGDVFSTGGFYPKANERAVALSTTRSIFPQLGGVKAIDLFNMKIPIPDNPEEMLEAMYGENWRVPVLDWQGSKELPNREHPAEVTYVVGLSLAFECLSGDGGAD